jgi:outer membrane receptor protein involved in Fe transport
MVLLHCTLRCVCICIVSCVFDCLCFPLYAQTAVYNVRGRVVDCKTGDPLEAAAIQLLSTRTWLVSDPKGEFHFNTLVGVTSLRVQMVGRHVLDTTFHVTDTETTIELRLCPSSLYLDEVVVTSLEAPTGSVSVLQKSALEHVQPTSVFDALQLLPGQLALNPDLSSPQQVLLRQASTSSAANRANALGTSLIVDGAPMSNNTNMQMNNTILNSAPGAAPPFSSVSGQGIDLRQIPADQIESIEVIRGVPSARYGDATAGMIIVTSKAGVYKPNYRFRINPTLIQNAVGAGFNVGTSTLNYDADVTAARDDPRDDVNRYQRLNQQMAWARRLLADHSLNTNIRLSYYRTLDEQKNKSADAQTLSERYSRDENLRFNVNMKWEIERKYLKSVLWNLTGSHGRQSSWFQDLVTRDIFPIGVAIKDTTQQGVYGKSEYLNQTRVGGKPTSIYSRLEFLTTVSTGAGLHEFSAGTEWRSEGNRGSGRQFDVITPPRQNYSVGERPRAYNDIPFLHQSSLYGEDRIVWPFGDIELTLIAGARLDLYKTSDWKNVVSPRINASLRLKHGFSIRAGYGHTAKMPTLSYLYPAPTFYDLINFNYYAANPAERLVIVTTRQLTPETKSLTAFKARKAEIGIDHSKGKINFTLSAFAEQTSNAYQYVRDLQNLLVEKLEASSYPQGSPPILNPVPVRIDTFMAAYDRPVNSLAIKTTGGEFTMNVTDWPLRKSMINLTGGYFRTTSTNDAEFLNADQAVFSNQGSGRVGIFAARQGQGSQRFSSAARFIYHLPSFGLIASALVQTTWIENTRIVGYDEFPVAFFNRRGETVRLSEAQASQADFSDMQRNVDDAQLQWQRRPVMWLFNVRLAKEWKPKNGFAFYINNLFNTNPLYVSSLTSYKQERNQPDLFFGAEVYLSL